MRPMELVIFGNPRGGTPLMAAAPSFGIELPLKLLAWQDADGTTRLTWSALAWTGARHGGAIGADKLEALDAGARALAEKAAHQ